MCVNLCLYDCILAPTLHTSFFRLDSGLLDRPCLYVCFILHPDEGAFDPKQGLCMLQYFNIKDSYC